MKYTGQTWRSFRTRFKGHLRDFKHGNGNSSFAQHLLENNHDFGPIEDVMSTVYITSKGRLMDTLEKYYIFRETKMGNQINDKITTRPNIIFQTIVQEDPHRGIPNFHHTG
jgi:myo-inositol-1-phosphate synthase